jgi:hypothetical protein
MKKMKKQKSFADLINQIDWISIKVYGNRGGKLETDSIMISFLSTSKSEKDFTKVVIRFGCDVLKKLEWIPGDRILPLYNPDDEMMFLVVKSDSSAGYKLYQETGLTSCNIKFKWTGKTILSYMASKVIPHEIHRKKLIFKIDSSQ